MRVLIQRVSKASVTIDGTIFSSIAQGLLIFVGIEDVDSDEDIFWLCNKILNLRIFNDSVGVMNLCVKDVEGELLVVSQFTLHACTKKGNRPSYIRASKFTFAIPMYNKFVSRLSESINVKTGVFGADMKVELLNDGPVTIWMDTKHLE